MCTSPFVVIWRPFPWCVIERHESCVAPEEDAAPAAIATAAIARKIISTIIGSLERIVEFPEAFAV